MTFSNLEGVNMFGDILGNAVSTVQGANAAVLMGFDGILVDLFNGKEGESVDIESMGMEFSVLLREVRNASELLNAGAANELTIRTDRLLAVLRVINDEYFVAMALSPEGNIGKARYVLRTMAPKIISEIT
jgi:predicted regulator of Ras-like GTPase activity (Roadblock/LC7/MglB family)